MPPIRTIPPAKAVKTERTHEENQERAYIAASRRSDRSLEARVESARRASEIHKRRTGRSLRVTEQDVINEEMYEEEDDDLPMQYRRLTAHLQTGSADFNRRLAAYLTNQVAMRSAVEQMAQNSYNQQYTNAPQFAQNRPVFQSSIGGHSITPSPNMSYRQAPYPNPHQTDFRQMHGRAYSAAAVPNDLSNSPNTPAAPHNGLDHRRMSTPASLQPATSQQIKTDGVAPDLDHQRQTQSASLGSFPPMWQDVSPFTTSLPPESQQMLAPALDPNDPFTASLMFGSENYISNPYYPWGGQTFGKHGQMMHPSYNGMSATLAPSALETGADALHKTPKGSSAVKAEIVTAPSSGLDFNFSQDSKGFPGTGMTRENSAQGLQSGQETPGDGFWDSFVQDGWNEEIAAD